ncbi:MAG: hypothetical protein Q4A79_03500, partial [Candidatus Saccharibacteria bacterium]|nr:hypothetical protein [Candidatus Saccharibacteria bacterium]
LEFNSLIRKIKSDGTKSFQKDKATIIPEGTRKDHFEVIRDNESERRSEPRDDGREQGGPRNDYLSSFKNKLIAWDIKSLMHSDPKIASSILKDNKGFWDLGQAAFLLNPLAREEPRLAVPEEEYQKQLTELQKYPKLYHIYTEFDLPLIPILYKMEEKGMLIDRNYFKKLEIEYTKEVAKLEHDIQELAGTTFNVNSPVQLSEVLFTKLGLPTKGIK